MGRGKGRVCLKDSHWIPFTNRSNAAPATRLGAHRDGFGLHHGGGAEPNQIPYKWIAIDKGTRQSLLRLSDLYQLRDFCDRLEWEVVDVKRVRRSLREAIIPRPEKPR